MKRTICLTTLVVILTAGVSLRAADSVGWHASGKGGAVAAGGAGAVKAGIGILEKGGNAADAAAATLLALAVTDYGSFSMGGEVPLIIFDAKSGKVMTLSGVGRAPLDPEAIKWFYENGIPSRGSMKAAPVPGTVHLCATLLERFGTISFEKAVTPTLALLDAGEKDWHPRLAVTLRKLIEAERSTSGTREAKLAAARDRFYKGDVADELEAWYISVGAFLRKRDLAAHETLLEEPASVRYRGYTVYKCGPWTQGPTLCQNLRLLEGFDLKQMGHLSADYIHVVTEAMKLGFADRDTYYGDPRFVDVPLDKLLSDPYTRIRRPLIDMAHASKEQRPGDPINMRPLRITGTAQASNSGIPVQDTTTCVVADRWGNMIAATSSCNLVGNKPGPSGVTQGNRIRSLNTAPGHPNRVQPGKRPRITLTPTLVTRNGKPVVAISVAGGDLQDQTTLNVLLNHIEFGMRPKKAVTAPRFSTGHHQDSFDPNPNRDKTFKAPGSLRVQVDVASEVQAELAKRGHEMRTTKGPIAHPVMIFVDHDTGTFYAAGDPAARRHAGAID